MLGNSPSGMLMKNMLLWATEAPARCGLFTYDLQAHISAHASSLTVCPSSESDEFSDGEEEDLYEPITPPPNFTIDSPPTDDTPFQPLNPAGRGLVGRYIFFKWPKDGWCLGQLSEWNSNPAEKLWGKVVNFKVQYFDQAQSTASHILSFDSYCTDGNGLAPPNSWVFLTPS